MASGSLDLPVVGSAAAVVAYAVLSLRAVPRRSARPAGEGAPRAFFAAAVVSAAWAALAFASTQWGGSALARMEAAVDVARYGCWFAFLLALLRPLRRRQSRFGYAAAVLLVAALSTQLAVGPQAEGDGPWATASRFSSMTLPVFGLVLAEQLFRNVSDESRWGIKPLCLGLSCIFVFDLFLYSHAVLFGRFDDDSLSVRSAVHAAAVLLLFVASQRNSDWLARLQVSRGAAFHSAALLLAGVYLLFISALGYYVRYFGGQWGRALQLGILVLALVALATMALSGALRARLRVWLGKHFFSYRYDYRREWLRFTATLSSAETPSETGGLVVRGLADMLECPAGGLWVKSSSGADFVQTAHWNVPRSDEREPATSAFAAFLLQRGWIIDLAAYRQDPRCYDGLSIPAWLSSSAQFWLVIPLLVADDLIGFVVLARPRAPIDVNWEVTDLLKTASRQAAGFLAQMRATEALLEVRKFDAFNRMSAFVVHDLKNIVTQLSLMMKNARRLHDNPEFQNDMMLTIDSSLDKMRQLMLQLREGEAPAGGTSGVALSPIVRRIGAVARSRGRVLEVDIVDPAATRGHEERIERVLGHVVQNAFDATPPDGRVWLRLRRVGGQAELEIGDTGHGMSPDFLQRRLFKPFQTTKTAGMGIGAYESFQYVQELGGSIRVDSQLDHGTVVTVLLPVFESRASADLHLLSET